MKQYNKILEAINRGINLALDDFENQDNELQQQTYGKVKNNYSTNFYFIYNKFLPYILCASDKPINECISYENYCAFVNVVNKLGIKVKFKYSVDIGDQIFRDTIRHIIFGWADKNLNLDLNWIDVSEIKNMSYLLANYPGNVNVSEWNVSNVERMDGLFAGSNFNGNLSKWNVSNVTNMMAMFEESKFNNDSIKNWNISNVEYMELMFMESEFNQDLNNWNWDIQEKCKVTAMFSKSKMELKNIPDWLKKRIKKQTLGGLK